MNKSFKALAGFLSILMLAATMSMSIGQAAQAKGKDMGLTGLEPVVTAVVAETAPNTPVTFTPETTSAGTDLTFCLPAASDRGCLSRADHTRAVVLEVRGEGSWVLDPISGAVTFNPVATFTGKTREVKYEATDAFGSGSAKIAVLVGKPAAPAISATLGTTFFNTPTTVKPEVTGGVIVNSSACLITDTGCAKELYVADEGTWSVNRNRSVTFTPELDFAGTATQVNYRIADAFGQAVIGAILIVVSNPEAPQLANSLVSTAFETSATFEPDVITSGAVNKDKTCVINPRDNLCSKQVKIRGEGIWSVNNQGKVSFEPESTYSGTSSPIEVRVSDKYRHTGGKCKNVDSCSAQVGRGFAQVRVRGPKTNLSVESVSSETEFDTPIKFSPVVSGAVAGTRVASCLYDPRDGVCKSVVLIESKGTWSVDAATGEITFTPLSTFAGQTSPIVYHASDKYGRGKNGNIKVKVRGPGAPTLDIRNNVIDTPINTPVDFTPNVHGRNIDYSTACLVDPTTTDCVSSVEVTGEGIWSISGTNGMVNFNPAEGFIGTAQPIVYELTSVHGSKKLCVTKTRDSHGRYNEGEFHDNQASNPEATYSCFKTGTVRLVVRVATGASLKVYSKLVTTPYATAATFLPRVSGAHIDNSSACLVDPADSVCKTTVEITDRGIFTVDTDTREVTFTPADGFVGQTAPIRYKVSNIYGREFASSNWVRVNVLAPEYTVVNETWATTPFNTPVLVTPDVTGRILSPASACLVDPADSVCKNQVEIADQGIFTVDNLTGKVNFVPNALFVGLVSPVDYQILDVYGHKRYSCLASPNSNVSTQDDNHNKDGDYEGDDENKHGHAQCASLLTTTLRIIVEDTAAPRVDPLSDTTNFQTAITVSPVVVAAENSSIDPALACLIDPLDKVCKTRVVTPGKGVWTVADGNVTFTPYNYFVGTTAPILYRAYDSLGRKYGQNTVTITVLSRHASVPGSTHKTTAFKTPITFAPNINATNPVNATACLVDPSDNLCKTTVVVARQGTWTVDTDTGEVTFSPLGDYVGTTGSLDYRIVDAYGVDVNAAHDKDECSAEDPLAYLSHKDDGHYTDHHGDGSHECFQILVNHVSVTVSKPTPPTVDEYTDSTNYDTKISGMQPNTTGYNLVTKLFCVINSSDECVINPDTVVTDDGTWEVAEDGSVSFSPTAGFVGDASIYYRIIDPFGQTASNKITVTVNEEDGLVVDDVTDNTDYFTPWVGTPNVTGTNIDYTTACFKDGLSCVKDLEVDGEGEWVIDRVTGEVTFGPNSAFVGTATAVTYYLEDAKGNSDTGIITITVDNPTDPGVDDIDETTPWNTPKEVSPKTSGLAVDVSKTCFIDPDTTLCVTSLKIDEQGTWTVDTDTGKVKFTPLRTFWGTTTSVTFQVENRFGGKKTASAKIKVSDPVGPTLTGPSTPTIDYMATKADITPTGTKGDGAITGYSFITEQPEKNSIVTSQGTWLINATTGVISFEAAEGFAGTTDAIGIRVTDEFGFYDDSTVTVIVNEPLAPVVDPKAVTTAFNTPVTFTPVITGDAIDYSTACVVDVADANTCKTEVTNSTGKWTVNTTNGAVTFAPATGFTGNSSIVYKISNDFGGTATGGQLTVTVDPAPFATLSGIVWFDLNKNNIQDANEPGLPGITVSATGANVTSMIRVNSASRASAGVSIQTVAAATVVTDSNGFYTFQVAPGVYTLKATLNSALVRKSYDADGGTDWSAEVNVASVGNNVASFAAAGDGAISGTVTINGSSAVANALVVCHWSGIDGILGNSDDVDLQGLADATGHLTFNGLPGGSFDCQGTDPVSGKQSAKKAIVVDVANSTAVEVAMPISKPRRYVFTVAGFPQGSPKMTKAMMIRILNVMKAHPGSKRVAVIGYTMGPSVLKVDYNLSMNRARVAWARVKAVDNLSRLISMRSVQVKKRTGSFIRRVTIALWFD